MFVFQAVAQLADGSVASGVGVMVKVTINNDVTTLFEDELLSQGEGGAISLDIAVPTHAKCMKISVSTKVTCMYVHISCNHTLTHTCTHTHTHTLTHTCTHTYTHTHIYTCTHTHIHTTYGYGIVMHALLTGA